MKIAISSLGNDLQANVDQRFGRTRWIIIYDTETDEFEVMDNSDNYNAPQGAGIKTAEAVHRKGCKAVITGHLGPKAFNVLKTAGIKGYSVESTTVKEAINQYKKGKLVEISGPDVKGHW